MSRQATDAAEAASHTRHGHRRRRTAWVAVAVVVLALAGVGIARFLTAEGAPTATAPPAPTTLADRIDQFEQRTNADPQDLRAWQSLGAAYVDRAIASGDPAFYELAGEAFDRADELSPDAPSTLLARGKLALSLHDFTRALDLGRRAREVLPAGSDPLGVIVDAEVELGRYDAAAEHLQQMVDLSPDVASLSRVSYLRELHGDRTGAIAAMRDAEQAGSGRAFEVASVTVLLGDLYLDTGNVDAARDAYQRAMSVSPGLLAADVGMARVEAATGDVDGAIERLRTATGRQPQPAALVLLGQLQELSGDEQAAAETADVVRSIARLQEDAGQAVALEMALFEADRGTDPQHAIDLATDAYEARPDNVFVADARAWALHRAGRSEDAVPYIEQAVRLGTAAPLVHYHAAEVFAATGDRQRARRHLEAAAASPWFSFAHLGAAGDRATELDVPAPAAWG